jgi:hypothetical protein
MWWLLLLLFSSGIALADTNIDPVQPGRIFLPSGVWAYASRPIIPNPAVPTVTLAGGTCAGALTTGGVTAGKITLSGACATTNTLAFTNLPAVPTGWICTVTDITTKLALAAQTASTTTGATITFQGTSPGANFVSTGASDVLLYTCMGY